MALTSATSQTSGMTASIVEGKIVLTNSGTFGPVGTVYRSTTQLDADNILGTDLSQYATAISATQYVNEELGEVYPSSITDNDSTNLTSGTYYYYATNGMMPDGNAMTLGAVAAVEEGRNFYGFEIDERWYNQATKRIEEALNAQKENE